MEVAYKTKMPEIQPIADAAIKSVYKKAEIGDKVLKEQTLGLTNNFMLPLFRRAFQG